MTPAWSQTNRFATTWKQRNFVRWQSGEPKLLQDSSLRWLAFSKNMPNIKKILGNRYLQYEPNYLKWMITRLIDFNYSVCPLKANKNGNTPIIITIWKTLVVIGVLYSSVNLAFNPMKCTKIGAIPFLSPSHSNDVYLGLTVGDLGALESSRKRAIRIEHKDKDNTNKHTHAHIPGWPNWSCDTFCVNHLVHRRRPNKHRVIFMLWWSSVCVKSGTTITSAGCRPRLLGVAYRWVKQNYRKSAWNNSTNVIMICKPETGFVFLSSHYGTGIFLLVMKMLEYNILLWEKQTTTNLLFRYLLSHFYPFVGGDRVSLSLLENLIRT